MEASVYALAIAIQQSEMRRYNVQSQLINSRRSKLLTLESLTYISHNEELPLDISVISTSIENGRTIYNCDMKSLTTGNTWTMTYRYSDFFNLKNNIQDNATCRALHCPGACHAVRDILWFSFPRKRFWGATSERVVDDRKQKFEFILVHLLRCILLPGSAMKCSTMSKNLPKLIFDFLGVRDPLDQRSYLHIYVDNHQKVWSHLPQQDNIELTSDKSEVPYCVICMDEMCDDCMNESANCDDTSTDNSIVTLPCDHMYHRECIFEWLLFQYHCPVCRQHIGPNTVATYCGPRNRFQWWFTDIDNENDDCTTNFSPLQ